MVPHSIKRLEAGLRIMSERETDISAFWNENIQAFRQTVLVAIRDTSDALLSQSISLRWRVELESQLEALLQYFELADRYIARGSVSRGPAASELRSSVPRIH